MAVLSNLIVRLGMSSEDFDKKLVTTSNKIKRLGAEVSEVGQALTMGFSLPMAAAAGYALSSAANMEVLSKSLATTMKSSEAAAREMENLKKVALLPGIGLEAAVQGSIRLQALGRSADDSRKIIVELSNALALVGASSDDMREVVRQLSQLASMGKVTKENLDPIIERIPQIAMIIRQEFGPQALGDPAKVFEKMGVSSEQFINVIIAKLGEGARAQDTYRNSMKNLRESAMQTAAEFGKSLLPAAQRILDEFLTPGIKKAKEMAEAFNALSPATQNSAIALGALATAAPLVIVALGTIVEKGGALLAVLVKLGPMMTKFAGAFSIISTAAGLAGIAVYEFMDLLNRNRQNTVDTSAEALKKLNERVGTGAPVSFGKGAEAIIRYMRALAPSTAEVDKAGAATEAAATKAEKLGKAYEFLKTPTTDMLLLHKRWNSEQSEFNHKLDEAEPILKRYNAITIEGALAAARKADEIARLNRILSEAPDMGGFNVDFKNIPKATMPTFPGSFEEFEKSSKNIGELGMQTKEQYDAMARAAKQSAREQSKAFQQVSTVITDLSRSVAKLIFDGGRFGDVMKNVALEAAQSITRLLIEGALKNLANKLMDVGGLFGKVFGGGTGMIKSAVGGGAGAAGGIVSSGASAAAGVAGKVAGAAMSGVVGMVTGAVSAVSGIIGNFQMAGMNKTLDLIEKEVRYSQIHLLYILEKQNEYLPKLKDIWDSLIRMEQRQMDFAGAGAGGVSITINTTGDTRQLLEALTRELKQLGVIPK
jgi:tape measure domain-containing protein